jgi:hypothetical protein
LARIRVVEARGNERNGERRRRRRKRRREKYLS